MNIARNMNKTVDMHMNMSIQPHTFMRFTVNMSIQPHTSMRIRMRLLGDSRCVSHLLSPTASA
jgi:hypothetical protein